MTTIAEAQATLSNAEREILRKQREADRDKLAAIQTQLRSARVEYARLRKAIRAEDTHRARAQAEVSKISERIAEHLADCPEIAEFLPDDVEVVAWQKRQDELTAAYDAAVLRRNSLPRTDRAHAAGFEGDNGVIAQLQYRERNVLAKLRGERLGDLFEL